MVVEAEREKLELAQARLPRILIVGDAPNRKTGLARIALDITQRLWATQLAEVSQLAWGYDGSPYPWRVYPVLDPDNWGQGDIENALIWSNADIILTIWDPARCYPIANLVKRTMPNVKLWGYFPIDAAGAVGDVLPGALGGPPAECLRSYDRVLGYTRFGAKVIRHTTQLPHVQHLPHGIDLGTFTPTPPKLGVKALFNDGVMIGCVAANQSRKDWGAVFAAARELRGQRYKDNLVLWCHVDQEINKYWSIPQLAEDYGMQDNLIVTKDLTDAELAQMYSTCDVTIAPGLGEGFGYPIVESLACGTPVIHVNYAGGAEFVPRKEWLLTPSHYRIEGPYNVIRPVLSYTALASKVMMVLENSAFAPGTLSHYCRTSVINLGWNYLWQRWASWFREGFRQL